MTTIEFHFEPRVERDKDLWSAYCDEFNLASSGGTEGEAEQNLVETLQAFARALRKRGLLEQTLDNAGLRWAAVETEGLRVAIVTT